jgi:hypothetical protein
LVAVVGHDAVDQPTVVLAGGVAVLPERRIRVGLEAMRQALDRPVDRDRFLH